MTLLEYFEENEDAFIEAIEELDRLTGYLGDDRCWDMNKLNEFYSGAEPLDILCSAFYGYDEDDSGCFNPAAKYYHLNGYGNFVSTDHKDYSSYLDEYFIKELKNNYMKLCISDETKEAIENDD